MNTFSKIKDKSEALELARAFIASNGDVESLYALLRLLDRINYKAGGYYAAYLDGSHFVCEESGESLSDELGRGGTSAREAIEFYREQAFTFLGE